MAQQRDLSRTRERIMAAAQKEFAASGFAGARADAIARRARVNERMIFYCFDSKEGLYRAVLKCKLSARAGMIESMPDKGPHQQHGQRFRGNLRRYRLTST